MASVQTAAPDRLLSAEEYARLPDNCSPTELVRGRVVTLNLAIPWHGYVCSKVDRMIGGFAEQNDLGYPITNDSGIVTGRGPDTVRGADFALYTCKRVSKGTLARKGYLAVAPDLVLEVKSNDERWKDILAKVAEYLNAGVDVVAVVDPERTTVTLYRPDSPEETLEADDALTFPELLPGFSVQVRRLFE
jgi:Uma2 family endonuclease